MESFSRITLVLTVLILLGAVGAKADTLLSFDLTGPVTATFELYAHPLISPGDADPGGGFTVDPIDLKINGVASNDFLAFYSSANDMGGAFAAFMSCRALTGANQVVVLLCAGCPWEL